MKTMRMMFEIGLLVSLVSSISAKAETFTLAELIGGQGFEIGATRFVTWSIDDTTADPSQITVETIDDAGFPGFQINANGELAANGETLGYSFTVQRTDLKPVIAGGLLELTGHTASSDGQINLNLDEDDAGGMELEVFVNDRGDTQLWDVGGLDDGLVASVRLSAWVTVATSGSGSAELDTYITQILLLSGSDDPVLTDLTISAGALAPAFDDKTRDYNATVPFDTTSVSVTATAAEGTTLTLNEEPITSGVASPLQDLIVGENEFVILLSTADSESSYSIVVNRQPEDAPVVEFTGSNATGIRNLSVGGILYDVEFVDGDATSVYGAFPGVFDFPDPTTGGPAEDAVFAVLTTLSTEPAVVTVGPSNSPIFNVGFSSFVFPYDGVDREWVSVAYGFYFNEWTSAASPEDNLYQLPTTFAVFSEPGSVLELTDLTISEGTLSPTFNANTKGYTTTAPFETTSMTVTATAEAGTTLTLNGQSITSGAPSPPQNLNVGENEFVILLSADGSETSYRVVVTREATPVLTGLTISEGTLSPNFDSNTGDYTATVPFDSTSVTVTATAQAGTTLTLNGQAITSGQASAPQNLNVGENELVILLSAAGAETSYRIVIARPPDPSALELTDLTISEGTLSPAFDGNTRGYTIDVPFETMSMTVTATAQAGTTLTLNGEPITSGQPSAPQSLNVGQTELLIRLSVAGSKSSYSIVVRRETDQVNMSPQTFVVNPGAIGSPAGTFVYGVQEPGTLSVDIVFQGGKTLIFEPGVDDPNTLSFFLTDSEEFVATPYSGFFLDELGNKIPGTDFTGTVEADAAQLELPVGTIWNGMRLTASFNADTYLLYWLPPVTPTVGVVPEPSEEPVLTDLTISEGTLSPAFNSDTTAYTATVPFETTSLTVTATAETGTTLTLNGQAITSGVPSPPQDLSVGDNELVILLSAAGSESSYSIVVTRDVKEVGPTVEFAGSNATGIRNLNVGGILYDVEFVEGAAETVYGAYPGVFDFPDLDEGPAEDAVDAILVALATEPAVVTVGPRNSPLFNVGYGAFSIPYMGTNLEFVDVAQAYYFDEWSAPSEPDSYVYPVSTTYADFTEVSSGAETPTLGIVLSAPDEVTISWSPATAGFVLQETADVGSGNWINSPSGAANPITLAVDEPGKFYRLAK